MNAATTRFSDRVEDYVRYRPGYPPELLPFFQNELGLSSQSVVADVGSGTGILSRLFLEQGNTVYAIEPNDAMRGAAETALREFDNFFSIKGTAEATGLLKEVDLITAAQAFHWFDQAHAKEEFNRIAHRHTYVVLIWNERRAVSPFEKDYEQLIREFSTDYTRVDHRNVGQEQINLFFAPHPVGYKEFGLEQRFGLEGLRGRLLSSSYVPASGQPVHKAMIEALKRLFGKYNQEGEIIISYQTKVFFGHIKKA